MELVGMRQCNKMLTPCGNNELTKVDCSVFLRFVPTSTSRRGTETLSQACKKTHLWYSLIQQNW